MDYFDQIKELAPIGMTDRQISDDLNEFEIKLFDALPWALDLKDEKQQNDLIVFCYRLRNRSRNN